MRSSGGSEGIDIAASRDGVVAIGDDTDGSSSIERGMSGRMGWYAGDLDGESSAGSGFAIDADGSLMGGDDALDQSEAETDPAGLAAEFRPPAVEALEDSRVIRGGNAGALIAHMDSGAGSFGRGLEVERDVDAGFRGRMFQGVIDEIDDDLAQGLIIHHRQYRVIGQVRPEPDPSVIGTGLKTSDRLANDGAKIGCGARRACVGTFESGVTQHVLNEKAKPTGLLQHQSEVLAAPVGFTG